MVSFTDTDCRWSYHNWSHWANVVWLGWSLRRRSCLKCGKVEVRRLIEGGGE